MSKSLIGYDVALFLDVDGNLVLTTDKRPRPGWIELSQTRAVRLNVPLDDVVTADVEFIVGGVDIDVPLGQARFIVADQEADAELVRAVQRAIKAKRALAIRMNPLAGEPATETRKESAMHIHLGDRVRDKITKLSGIAVGVTEWLYGCRRIGVQPEEGKDGKPIEQFWVDEPQLEVVARGVILVAAMRTPDATGGPRPEPMRNNDPAR